MVKGAYRDAVRRAKPFRERKKRGKACKDRPEVRRVAITYSDSQDWRLENGVIKLRTHRGWVKLHYRNHKQLHRYLYGGWRLASELRFKLLGRRIAVYPTFAKDFDVNYNPRNVAAVDVNETTLLSLSLGAVLLQMSIGLRPALVGLLSPTLRGGRE
ncbi:MAG: hypothetical protein LM564_02700 [Desulfurococcaceae archaeon]|nr:hypothetical protein [Desulfurococcaceae archaeon]